MSLLPHMTENLSEAVFQALGTASMCWSETPQGVFDSEQAERVGHELLVKIIEITGCYRPNLGLATTLELAEELHARADVAHVVGEAWPLYTTIGGQ